MKAITKCLILFLLLIGARTYAQWPGDSKVLASNTSVKGRMELSREKHVKKREHRHERHEQHQALKKHTMYTLYKPLHFRKRHSPIKNKEKNKPKNGSKPLEATAQK